MNHRSAFTLVELAIVLVIIGLIVGGVLVGKDLIRNAELQTIITEKEHYTAALWTFRGKYNALPGDISNAHQYFGDDCGTNTTDINTGCNGNGDGLIGRGPTVVDIGGETHKTWSHLSRAGLVKGKFSGSGTLNGQLIIHSPENIPSSRYPNAYWSFNMQGGDMANQATVGNAIYLELGNISGGNGGQLNPIPDLSNSEALRVDIKADDGTADYGTLRGDTRYDCYDQGTDYYSVITAGRDTVGNCMFHFIL